MYDLTLCPFSDPHLQAHSKAPVPRCPAPVCAWCCDMCQAFLGGRPRFPRATRAQVRCGARLSRQGVEWTAMGPGGQSCLVGHWDIQVMDNLVQKNHFGLESTDTAIWHKGQLHVLLQHTSTQVCHTKTPDHYTPAVHRTGVLSPGLCGRQTAAERL